MKIGIIVFIGIVLLIAAMCKVDDLLYDPKIEKNNLTGEWRVLFWGSFMGIDSPGWSVAWQGKDSVEAVRQYEKHMRERHGTCEETPDPNWKTQ